MVFLCLVQIMNSKKPPKKEYTIKPLYLRVNANPEFTGKGVTVAFIDSGFYAHPDLHSRIVKMIDVTGEKFSEDDFRSVRASSWHGTMVACAACGNGHFSKGYYRGIAPDARVVLIKAFDGKKVRASSIYKALLWVRDHHARHAIRIVNISLGGDRNEPLTKSKLCRILHELKNLGITVVAAAGNNPDKPIIPPASCPDAITIGGIDDKNSLDQRFFSEYGSSYGHTLDGLMKPEIVAPSKLLPAPMVLENEIFEESQILHSVMKTPLNKLKIKLRSALTKTKLDRAVLNLPPKEIKKAVQMRLDAEKFFAPYYQHVDGTSFAAPIVTSVIAQMLEANPKLTPTLIKMILETTARRLPDIAPEKQGYGLLTARACVQQALEETHLLKTEASPMIRKDRIVFYYHDHEARKVCLIGDFTAWQKDMILLKEIDRGIWRADLPLLSPGRYQYKFFVNNQNWKEDPLNPRKENDHYNGMNSVLEVTLS
jgi:serine protease AprX